MKNSNSFLPDKTTINRCRILVVGDVMLDRYWHGDVDRISPEAPVPVVHIKREVDRLGGAANVALNIKTLGAQVSLLSTVGADLAAQSLRKILLECNIQSDLLVDPSMETIVKLRVIGRSHQMLRIDFEKVPNNAVLNSMLDKYLLLLNNHDVVLFSDYGKGGLQHISHMISLAKKIGKLTLVDPKGKDWLRYRYASVIAPNRSELAQVIGSWQSEAELNEKAKDLRNKLDFNALLLTRSEEGMTLFEKDRVTTTAAQAREVSDVTGAGDTVIATMAVMVACGLNPLQAMHWANRAGGLVVEKFGAASVTYDELYE
jgi:rfaE bifunctional protein kinase chain/domain